MLEQFTATIEYDAEFSPGNIRRCLLELREAIAENWREFSDEWSLSVPAAPIDVEGWTAQCKPDSMFPLGSFRESGAHVQFFDMSFSPQSAYLGTVYITRLLDGRLSVGIGVPQAALYEDKGDREQYRMEWVWDEIRQQRGEDSSGKRGPDPGHPDYDAWWRKWNRLEDIEESVWPQNKKCLQRIIRRLAALFPVRQVEIDDALRDETS